MKTSSAIRSGAPNADSATSVVEARESTHRQWNTPKEWTFQQAIIAVVCATHELPAIDLQGGYSFSARREVNCINLRAIPPRITLHFVLYKALVVIPIGRL